MTRTRQQNKDVDIVDSLADRIKRKTFNKLAMTASAGPNFTGIDGHPTTGITGNDSYSNNSVPKSRNAVSQRKITKKAASKRSHSRSSRIEGKLNEAEMLPLVEDLSEEELNKYRLN
jgi:hypothetical protein